MRVHADLIFDVGLHVGRDAEFYLNKGFRVVAVEANPALVQQACSKFQKWIAEGRLTLVAKAISSTPGEIQFYVNLDKDDWSSTDREIGARQGTTCQEVTVSTTTLNELLSIHGAPYYAKIDVEGADIDCLQQLLRAKVRPIYLSIEGEIEDSTKLDEQLRLLDELGYNRFQIVNQVLNERTQAPLTPREGSYVDWKFDGYSSGLFGKELPDKWMNSRSLRRTMHRLLRANRFHGKQGLVLGEKQSPGGLRVLYERVYHSMRRRLGCPLGWYDIHATV